MDYVSNQEQQIKEMLTAIGVKNVEELWRNIPQQMICQRPQTEDGLSEFEGLQHMQDLAKKNHFAERSSFLGAGAYEHYVPAIVEAICSKSEFLTSYTPYQAEASQGMLQAAFEFQSTICALTGMDVANSSVYDGASACAEALLMALRHQPSKNRVVVAGSLHPHYRAVVEQYLDRPGIDCQIIPLTKEGLLDREKLFALLNEQTAAVLLAYPNFFGTIENTAELIAEIQKKDVLTVLCANPLIYGMFASAGELGADIAVGDTQPFGLPLQYGGPYVGYIACREKLLRQLPGRIVGETVDSQGRRGFVLTLQAREQYIRREKATSNICTNQALAALASTITLLWYGPKGIQKLAITNYQRAAYLREHLHVLPGIKLLNTAPCFNEFAFSFSLPIDQVLAHFHSAGIEPGLPLGRFFPQFKEFILVAVTETKSKERLDHYVAVAKKLVSGS